MRGDKKNPEMTPREFFPHMPDEVFDSWLAPFIDQIGWPFETLDADLSSSRWKYLLGLVPLPVWHGCTWSLETINIAAVQINPSSEWAYRSIIDHCTTGSLTTITANLQDTQERFRACTEYVRAHGTIPVPIIAIARNNMLEVMDGNHRLAALFHVGVSDPCWITAWMPLPASE